jgi:LAGLIDADG endonuclease
LYKIILPHFDKYPLITQKQNDFLIFKYIVILMKEGKHLNEEDIVEIFKLKTNLNKGVSDKLKMYFPEIVKSDRSDIVLPDDIDYN